MEKHKYYIVAIDGRAAAGKSMLAERLQREFERSAVVHMDDFFLPPELRTKTRYQEPGGNVHHERFQEEVLTPLREGTLHSYRRFSCHSMSYEREPIVLGDPVLVIVEGAYATSPRFGHFYDLSIFLDVAPAIQKERICNRNGKENWVNFETKWIPMEENYIRHYRVAENCDHIVTTESFTTAGLTDKIVNNIMQLSYQ
ncbi:MAG: uridine kinase [Lachnospiraceae bacterium]|nr:uridine kinase [Lachnospiraceae bacterium]